MGPTEGWGPSFFVPFQIRFVNPADAGLTGGGSAGLRGLQNGGKGSQCVIGLRDGLLVRQGLRSDLQEDFAAVFEVFRHDLKQRAGVDRMSVSFSDGYR